MFVVLNKVVTLVFWLLALVAWMQGWEGWLAMLPTVALVIAGVHLLEVAYFWTSLRKRSNNPGMDALQIFIFGIFHMQQFIQQAASDEKDA